MAVTKIPFDHHGGVISILIEYQGLVAASYTYTLWEANSNDIVAQRKGNNQNPEDDRYNLPSPATVNTKRLIDVHSTVKGLYEHENEGNYKVIITIFQDGIEIGRNVQPSSPKPIGDNVVVHQYYALLV